MINLLREWLAEYRAHPVPAAILAGVAMLALVLGVTVFVIRHADSAFPGKAGNTVKTAGSPARTQPFPVTPPLTSAPRPSASRLSPGSARIPGLLSPATVTVTSRPSQPPSSTAPPLPSPKPTPSAPSPPPPEPSPPSSPPPTSPPASSSTPSSPPPSLSSPPSSPSGATLPSGGSP